MSNQQRLILWAAPRTISTAFFRAMMNRKSVRVLLEPYSRAYYFGEERRSGRYADEPQHDNCKFADIRLQCEEESDKDVVFVKDMAYYITHKLGKEDILPQGYQHTFLIRNPTKAVYSLYKMSLNKELTGWNSFDANEVGFKELHQLFEFVRDEVGQEPLVIDADDLLQHPEDMLRQYCERCGVDFEGSMLTWDEVPTDMSVFQDWMPWFEGVLTSKSFQPSATKPKSPQVYPNLPRHVQQAIDDNMPYYLKMYETRVKPSAGKTLTLG